MAMLIKNCLITKTDCRVLKPFIDTPKSYQYRLYKGYHPGIDLECKKVYAPCHTTLLYVGYDEDRKQCVVLQYDSDICLRFSNLDTIAVTDEFQKIEQGTLLGTCKRFLHFEVLSYFTQSDWPVRILDTDYFKIDPTDYADPSFEWNLRSQYVPSAINDDGTIELDPMIQTVFETEVLP